MVGFFKVITFCISIVFFSPLQQAFASEQQISVTAYVPLSKVWEKEIAKNTHVAVCRALYNTTITNEKHLTTQDHFKALKTNFKRQEPLCYQLDRTGFLTIARDETITIRILSQGFPKVTLPPQTIIMKNDTNYISSISASFVEFKFKADKKGKYHLAFENRTYEKPFEIERKLHIIVE